MHRTLRALALLLVFSCNSSDPTPPPRDRPHPDMAPHFEQIDAGVDAGEVDGGAPQDGGDKADGGVDAGEVADGGAEDGGDSSDAG